MANNIYALLVGIDEYDPTSTQQIPSLKGCVNDIKAVEAYLRDRITKDGKWKLVEPINQSWILTNEQATRQAVINGFLEHLCYSDSEDVVLFYYAGHGAQEKAPEEFWHLEADRLDESLVCYDSRTENSRDLADKEIAYLISKVAENNPHVVIILDCCHSGSGTRDISPEIRVRRSPVDSRERPLSSFIFAEDTRALNELLNSSRTSEQKKTGVILPKGKHVMFSACRDYELAKEYKGDDGQPRGAFSYFLLQTLQRNNSSMTYRDLARNLNVLMSSKVKEQSPQVEAIDPKDLDRPFLGGTIKERPNYFTLTRSQNDNSWVIDAGAISGIPKPSQDGDTLLAIFPAASTPEQLTQLSQALGEAQVMQVLPQKSKVKILSGSDRLSPTETYWAIVTNIPLPPLKIYIRNEDSEKAGLELVKQALQTSAPNSKPSLYVSLVEDPTYADYDLIVRGGQYWITQPHEQRPLIAPIPENSAQAGYTSENAREVVVRLEHIARWTNILELSTPATSSVKTDDVEMEISVLSGRQETSLSGDEKIASEMRLEYTYENEQWIPPIIEIKLTNNSNKPLYCNVLDLTESYSISSNLLDEYQASSFKIPPKDSGKNNQIESGNLQLVIKDEYLVLGITEYKDIFKLIVSTSEFDASLLQQDGLNPPPPTRSVAGGGTLDRLMAGVNSREAVRAEGSYDNWMTKQVSITIVCPQEARAIQSNSSTALQNGVVEVQPHPSLQAKVNLTTVTQANRDLGNFIRPAILRQQPRFSESFQFTTSRGSDPGLSALELSDVEDHTVVTAAEPLKLLVDTQLKENEHLLAFAYDGQFFLPLGRGSQATNGKTEITLERLPNPTVSNRSIHGSIRIFFEKIVSQKIGSPYEYPILAIANVVKVGEKDKVTYEKDKEIIKARVAQSKKIILYIHGIVGDTASMVPSVNHAFVEVDKKQLSIKDRYDVVLAFDYENIQTTIEENARSLKEKLQEIGLGANHGKQLHIVAHSMGGLVSRWFIERLGGNQVVQHLVMLGTPNAGSPWPDIQNWVFTALGIGLNQLSAIVWPTKIVAELLEVLENNDNSLEQMQPDSPILKELAENPDPGVAYTIIAGDRSVMATANAALQADNQINPLKQLMDKMFGSSVNKVVDMAFFTQPNDIAVTLTSIKSVNSKRSPQPRILPPDAACDHLTYFTHPAGLAALSRALYESPQSENQPPAASATNKVKTRLCYFGVELPTKDLAVGEDLTLKLNFTPDSQLGSSSIRVPVNTLEVTIYIEAPGFYLQGEHTRTLPVKDGDLMERSLTLNLTPLISGDRTINLSIYPGGRLPNLSPEKLPIKVRVNTPTSLPNIPDLIDRRAIPAPEPDVILHVTLEEVLKEEQLTGLQRVGLYLTCPALSCDRQPLEALHFTANELETLRQSAIQAAAVANGSPVDVLTSLQAIGATLFDRLMPIEHPLRNYYWELFNLTDSDTPLSWLIVSEAKAVLPWELVCAYYKEDTGKNWYDEFLAQKFILAHWVGYQGLKLTNEAPLLKLGLTHYNQRPENLSRWEKVLGSEAQAKSNQQSGLLDLMQPSSSCYGLHILRYTDPRQTGQITSYETNTKLASGKTLNQAEELLYNQRLDFTLRRPVVGLSLVDGQTANRGMAMSGSDNQLETDWMLPLMHAGASALVGSRWSVLPESDRLFYRTFYNLMRSGTELGSAVWQARKDVRLAFPHRSDWLAYTYFGHPQCQPYLVRLSQGFTFFEAINPPENEKFLAGESYDFRASYRTEAPVWYSGRLSLQEISKEAEDLSVMMVRLTGEMPPEFYQLEPVASKESYQHIITITMPSKEMILPLLIRFQKGSEELNTLFLNLNVVDRGQS